MKSFLVMVDSMWWERSFHFGLRPRDLMVDPALWNWSVESSWRLISNVFYVCSIYLVSRLYEESDLWYSLTCGYRYPPRQPIAMCLICVIEPEIIVRSRKSVRELNWIADLSRWYRRVRRWVAIRRVIDKPVKAILLFVHVRDFYHEVSTKTVLQWLKIENEIFILCWNKFKLIGDIFELDQRA